MEKQEDIKTIPLKIDNEPKDKCQELEEKIEKLRMELQSQRFITNSLLDIFLSLNNETGLNEDDDEEEDEEDEENIEQEIYMPVKKTRTKPIKIIKNNSFCKKKVCKR